MRRPCIVNGCTAEQHGRGLCPKHYWRYRIHGTTDKRKPKPWRADTRFWPNVTKGPECWEWTASKTAGYGNLRVEGKVLRAHRVSYVLAYGSIPDGLALDHICRNRACVNPAHLRPVTDKQNQENRDGTVRNNLPRGVTRHPKCKKFRVRVTHNRVNYFVGSFTTVEEAEEAAIAKRNELYTHNDTDRRRQSRSTTTERSAA